MSQAETRFWNTIRPKLEKAGAYAVKFHGNQFTKAGVADIHVDHEICSSWLELKCDIRKYTCLQVKNMQNVRKAGALSYGFRYMTVEKVFIIEDYDHKVPDGKPFKGQLLKVLYPPFDAEDFLNELVNLAPIIRAGEIAKAGFYDTEAL